MKNERAAIFEFFLKQKTQEKHRTYIRNPIFTFFDL